MNPKESNNAEHAKKPDAEGFEVIVNSLGAGICRMDSSGAVIYANESALRILRRSNSETLGLHYSVVLFGEETVKTDSKCAPFEFTLSEAEVSHINTESLLRPDGTEFLAEIMCVPVADKTKAGGAVVSMVDVTDRREIEEALSFAREEALSAARSKAEFLANMSHEIRTPLTGIIGTVDLLSSSGLNEDQSEFVRMLRTSTEFLHSIVNDILDFSKIEAGKFYPQKGVFNLSDLASSCFDPIRATASSKGVELRIELETGLPVFVNGDERITRQVLNNLLSNAIKFTATGSISLSVSKAAQEGVYRFSAKDTGVGISADNLSGIFDAFTQADASNRRSHSGTGLGLAISRRLVEISNGQIGIKSEPDKGTEVWFEIPLETIDFREQVPIFESMGISNRKGLEILVVEDNPINLRVMEKMLERLGYSPDLAENGQEAVEACRDKGYDIVFMDCQMPLMDGFEAARKIKTETGKNPSIIAFTASVTEGEVAKTNKGGMDGLLRKPFTEKDLIDVLNANSDAEVEIKTLDLPTDFREHSVSQYIDSDTLVRLSKLKTEDSRGFLVEIFEVFTDHTAKNLKLLSEFVASEDRAEIKRIAHNLKGSSANVGISRLSQLFEELENESADFTRKELETLLHSITAEYEAVNTAIAELKKKDDPNESQHGIGSKN